MEPQDQVSTSNKSMLENEGMELQIKISSDILSSEQNDPGSVNENLKEIKSSSGVVSCMPENDKDKDIPSTESSQVISELKSESEKDESRNVSVEKEESLCLLSDLSNMTANNEKSNTIPVEVGDISQEKDVSQSISNEAMAGGEKFETTSNKPSFSTSSIDDKALSRTNRLTSSDNPQQQIDRENVFEYTGKASQTINSGTAGGVSRVDSLQSVNMRQKDTESENLQVDADSVSENIEIHEKKNLPDPFPYLTIASVAAGDESVTIKNSTDQAETTAMKNTDNNGTPDFIETDSEGNAVNEQSRNKTKTTCEENIAFKTSAATTKIAADENVADKHSTDTPETVGGNVTKDHLNKPDEIDILHLKQGENVTNKSTAKTVGENATKEHSIPDKIDVLHMKQDGNVTSKPTTTTVVGETASNKTADVGTSDTEPQSGETEDDSERAAFFYMSSCSVPGMGKEWDWPSVSSGHHYQRPLRRMERRRNTSESRNCLGTQRCHYIILAVGVLGAILGCLTYHLQDYGIGPKVLRPIGASAAFLSFVVCAFSSVYLTYLSYYTQGRSPHNYQPVGAADPVASMLIDTMPQGYNSDPRFYFTSSAAATFQQVFRETQSADALDRRGFSWHQTDFKRPFDKPGPSGYDPDSKRFKKDPTTSEGEVYEMKSISRIGEKDRSKERNPSQASDSSHYTLADQVYHTNSSGESEDGEKTPLLRKK